MSEIIYEKDWKPPGNISSNLVPFLGQKSLREFSLLIVNEAVKSQLKKHPDSLELVQKMEIVWNVFQGLELESSELQNLFVSARQIAINAHKRNETGFSSFGLVADGLASFLAGLKDGLAVDFEKAISFSVRGMESSLGAI